MSVCLPSFFSHRPTPHSQPIFQTSHRCICWTSGRAYTDQQETLFSNFRVESNNKNEIWLELHLDALLKVLKSADSSSESSSISDSHPIPHRCAPSPVASLLLYLHLLPLITFFSPGHYRRELSDRPSCFLDLSKLMVQSTTVSLTLVTLPASKMAKSASSSTSGVIRQYGRLIFVAG